MVFKRFKYVALFYLVLIILSFSAGVYIFFNTYFWLTSIWLFVSGILLIILLLNFITKEHRKLSYFLVSINHDDFNPPTTKNYEDVDFNRAFDKLSQVIKTLRDEAQINYHYLQTIVDQINTAIVCVNDKEKVILSNSAANKLFKKRVLRNIDSLQVYSSNLPDVLKKLRLSEKKLIKFRVDGKIQSYSIQLSEFKIKSESIRLFNFQNVQSELEQNEIESWQKLTRVMSHEIMNSAIPISNLSNLVQKKLFLGNSKIDEQESDIKESLQTIESRSKGLVDFIEATRNFTKMPDPTFENVGLKEVLNRTETLLQPRLKELNVAFEISNQAGLEIIADKSLIEQVLINIVLNAIDAVQDKESPKIVVSTSENSEGKVLIAIEDNGNGIPEKEIENIFIPFYTTKVKGSGIGLSLARQVMFLHKGTITVNSNVGFGTKFVLSF